MWGAISSIAMLAFVLLAFGGGDALLKHRQEMKKLGTEASKAKAEEHREQRLLIEAQNKAAS